MALQPQSLLLNERFVNYFVSHTISYLILLLLLALLCSPKFVTHFIFDVDYSIYR